MTKARAGTITIPADAGVWEHEERTAKYLAKAGYNVTFIKKGEGDHRKTPDALIDGELWEIKAPKASSARAVERNLHRALQQATRVVFDSHRMKSLPDSVVERELHKRVVELRSCKRLLFVDKRGKVIDIK